MEAEAFAVEAIGLTKRFGATAAVDGLNLAVPAGCVYGFLGRNGAGKTTTIRILTTLLKPDEGVARVLGHDVVREPQAVRAKISLTGQFASVDDDLTGHENLVLLAKLRGYASAAARRRAEDLLDAFELSGAARRPVKTLSGGMRRRLDIAASVIVRPEVLFLDEPTTGLDPHSRNDVWGIVRAVAASGTSVLLTTQYLDEADQLTDRIAVIDRGSVIAEGTSGQLKSAVGTGKLRIRLVDPSQQDAARREVAALLKAPVSADSDPAALSAHVPAGPADAEAVASMVAELCRTGIQVVEFSLGQPTLDEVFLALTGEQTPARMQEEAS